MLYCRKSQIRIVSFFLSLIFLLCPHIIVHADALTSGEASTADTAPGPEVETTVYEESSGTVFETIPDDVSGDNIEAFDPTASVTAIDVASSTLPDGIYAFQNRGNPGRWMDIEQNLTTPGHHVQQYAFSSSPAESYSASGLYKVTRVGSTDRFIIRLMLNQNLTFGFSGNEVLTKTIPSDDASVSISDTFYITYDHYDYTIRPYGSSYYISANDTSASGASGAPDSYLSKRTLSDAGNRARWILEGYQTPIPNGVYALKNLGNTDRWMDVQWNQHRPGYHMQQYAYSTPPTESFSRGGLCKISQVGTTGQYVIRLMVNNLLSFGFEGSEVITKTIPASDASVAVSDRFTITFYNGGYVIKPCGSNYCISANNTTASGADGAPDSYLTKRTRNSAGTRAMWDLYRYTGAERYGCLYSTPTGFDGFLKAGESVSVDCTTWSTRIGANTPSILNETPDLASLSWNSTTNMATITAKEPGTVSLKVKIRNGSTVIHQLSYHMTALLPQDESTYFVQNRNYELYAQVNNDDAPNYTNNGGIMEIFEFDGGDYQKWVFTHVGSGYYKITSAVSGYAITVPSGEETNDDVDLILTPYTGSDNQKWKIAYTVNGSYKIKAKSSESYTSKDLVMDLQTKTFQDTGLNIRQREYKDNTSYKDEWFLHMHKDYTLMYIGKEAGDPLMTPIVNAVESKLKSSAKMSGYSYTALNKDELLVHLSSSSLFSCITHGSPELIVTTDGYLTISDIDSLANTAFDNLEFVYLGACLTGQGRNSGNNLVNAIYNKGADTVLGFTDTVLIKETNSWTKAFMTSLATGKTVDEAMQDADITVANEFNAQNYTTDVNHRYLVGSSQIRPCT